MKNNDYRITAVDKTGKTIFFGIRCIVDGINSIGYTNSDGTLRASMSIEEFIEKIRTGPRQRF